MDDTYRSAVAHLEFSGNLEEAVLKCRPQKRTPVIRIVSLAAVLCALLATTVFAAGGMIERGQRLRKIGNVVNDFSDAEIMQFSEAQTMEDVSVHYMDLGANSHYKFKNGMLYDWQNGFFRVTEDYQLEALKYHHLEVGIKKNDRIYRFETEYVKVEQGIYSQYLVFYPIENGEILVCGIAPGSNLWPLYVNLETGAVRDAVPDFTEDDFTGRIGYAEPFRDGILVSSIEEQIGNGETKSHVYWIGTGSTECIELLLPKGWTYVSGDTMYYQDTNNRCYILDENFELQKMDEIPKTTDDVTKGLLTLREADGTLGIADLDGHIIYHIPDVSVPFNSLYDTTGYNATRHSTDGKIVITHTYHDWEKESLQLDSLSYLDIESGQLKRLELDTNYRIISHGWLDDNRYGVIYGEGASRYLCIFEF